MTAGRATAPAKVEHAEPGRSQYSVHASQNAELVNAAGERMQIEHQKFEIAKEAQQVKVDAPVDHSGQVINTTTTTTNNNNNHIFWPTSRAWPSDTSATYIQNRSGHYDEEFVWNECQKAFCTRADTARQSEHM